MPHIVIQGPVQLEAFFKEYAPSVHPLSGGALKLLDIFINQDRTGLLIEAVAAEGGPPNRFFIQVLQRDLKTTVKIFTGNDPEKTPGVKKLLAIVAHAIKTDNPETVYGPTNLQEYLL